MTIELNQNMRLESLRKIQYSDPDSSNSRKNETKKSVELNKAGN